MKQMTKNNQIRGGLLNGCALNNNLGIKINVDYSSIDDLAKKINQLTKDKLEIDLKLNTSKATERLTTFKSKYDELKTYMKDGLDLKLDSNGSFDSLRT